MKIQVLRKMKYLNTYIYIFQFEYVFMYLFSFNNEIYQDRISLIPSLFARLLWKLRIVDNPFVQEQLEEGEKVVLSGAMASLDRLNDPKVKAERKKANELIKREKKLNNCVWQAREGKDDMYYLCLTHKAIAKMVEGEQPRHN